MDISKVNKQTLKQKEAKIFPLLKMLSLFCAFAIFSPSIDRSFEIYDYLQIDGEQMVNVRKRESIFTRGKLLIGKGANLGNLENHCAIGLKFLTQIGIGLVVIQRYCKTTMWLKNGHWLKKTQSLRVTVVFLTLTITQRHG